MSLFDRLRRLMPERETLANNRWLRWLGPSLLHPRLWHLNRHGVAKGAAIGVFFAFVTPIAQIPLSAGLSVLLRANVPAAVVGTLVNTPPTFGPVYYAAWRVGSWVLDEPMDQAHTPAVLGAPERAASAPQGWWARTAGTLQEVGKPLFLGALIFSVIGSVLAYGLVNGMWVWRVRAKRKKRLGARR